MTTTNKMDISLEDTLLDGINQKYEAAVSLWKKDMDAFITACEFTSNADKESLLALQVANNVIYNMYLDFVIEDLDWKGNILPQYDWCNWNLELINDHAYNLFNIENKYTSIESFLNLLFELKKHNVLTNITSNFSDGEGYFNFDLIGFDAHSLREFQAKYEALRNLIGYFH